VLVDELREFHLFCFHWPVDPVESGLVKGRSTFNRRPVPPFPGKGLCKTERFENGDANFAVILQAYQREALENMGVLKPGVEHGLFMGWAALRQHSGIKA